MIQRSANLPRNNYLPLDTLLNERLAEDADGRKIDRPRGAFPPAMTFGDRLSR